MKPSYVAVGVLGLALGGLWYTAGGTRPPAAQAAERLQVADPVSHENLAVFFVHGPDAVDDARVVTLQEALDRKWAVVHETGQVNELAVENLSPDYELFVQSGDMIKGGRQDRLIATDLLVPPASGRVPVRAHCVEAGRWAGRPNEAAVHFSSSDSCAVGNSIKLANADLNQTEVWANVKVQQDKLTKTVGTSVNAVASPTSLQLALENPAVRAKAEGYRTALKAAGEMRGVVGAVFVVNGKVTSAEVYGSSGLFRKAWPKLLKAASEEALAEKADGRTSRPPTARAVEQFLAASAKAEPADAIEPAVSGFSGRSGATRQTVLRTGSLGNNRARVLSLEAAEAEGDTIVHVAQTDGVALVNQNPALQFRLPNPEPALQNQDQQQTLRGGRDLDPRYRRAQNRSTAEVTRENADLASVQTEGEGFVPPRPTNSNGNRLNTNRVENRSTLMLESKDQARNVVIHRSYIQK